MGDAEIKARDLEHIELGLISLNFTNRLFHFCWRMTVVIDKWTVVRKERKGKG